MREIPLTRRLLLAGLGIAITACLTRAQIADAIVLRGDECLYRSKPESGLRYYRRALWVDAGDGVAVDRFLFVAMTLRDGTALRDGIRAASSYLEENPHDDVVLLDRAMAYRALGQSADALADFSLIGSRRADARALTFAGYEARALGRSILARSLWRRALRIDPRIVAARHALERSGAIR
jgi:tetratricopeptide (TPR) repeat protein